METITLANGKVELISPQNILYISFHGEIADADYKEIWQTGVDTAVQKDVKKFIFDQSQVKKVGFSSRAWVILKMLPYIKNEIGSGIKVGVVSSKDMINKSGLRYLVGMFEKMANLKVNFFPELDAAIEGVSKM